MPLQNSELYKTFKSKILMLLSTNALRSATPKRSCNNYLSYDNARVTHPLSHTFHGFYIDIKLAPEVDVVLHRSTGIRCATVIEGKDGTCKVVGESGSLFLFIARFLSYCSFYI